MDIAREAGSILTGYYGRIPYELKAEFDLVTDADRASERFIVEQLSARFPAHGIVAEEGGGRESRSEYCWYVDPLDGTTNFAHGYPMWCVTIALRRGEEMIAGCVFDPLRNEMFSAERGSGAYLNNRRIRVSKVPSLEQALVCTGYPSRRRHQDINIHFFYQLSMWTHGVRRGGSAAIDLSYVASGRLELFWEFGLRPWDMAAGTLIVTEAGGSVTSMTGAPFDLNGPTVLADNGAIHAETLEIFGEVFRGRYRTPLPDPAKPSPLQAPRA